MILTFLSSWLILDKDDPSKILARSKTALMIPTFEYETLCEGNPSCPYIGERKNVIFMCSADPIGPNKFRLFFGGGDGNVGTAVLSVDMSD